MEVDEKAVFRFLDLSVLLLASQVFWAKIVPQTV
jgi:hypothetical protein